MNYVPMHSQDRADSEYVSLFTSPKYHPLRAIIKHVRVQRL